MNADAPTPSTAAPSAPTPPLAPSVEKAYYRKCIALKRRLNQVELANDDAKIRRLRLDRAIMKMRLERAFLLDELRRRMEVNIDGSEGSGEEGVVTPPEKERPLRDKRRGGGGQRPGSGGPGMGMQGLPGVQGQFGMPANQSRQPSDPNVGQGGMVPPPPQHMGGEEGRYYAEQQQRYAQQQGPPPPMPHGSPYGPPPNGLPGSGGRSGRVNSMEMGAPPSQGMGNGEGERRIMSSSAESGEREREQGAFAAVNQ